MEMISFMISISLVCEIFRIYQIKLNFTFTYVTWPLEYLELHTWRSLYFPGSAAADSEGTKVSEKGSEISTAGTDGKMARPGKEPVLSNQRL